MSDTEDPVSRAVADLARNQREEDERRRAEHRWREQTRAAQQQALIDDFGRTFAATGGGPTARPGPEPSALERCKAAVRALSAGDRQQFLLWVANGMKE
jgi:hypothetical protein